MWEYLQPPAIYVHLAATMYVIGMLIREQLLLRSFVLAGTGFYIVYYYIVSDTPLWEAMAWSAAIGVTNFYSMVMIMLERSRFGLSDSEQALLNRFSSLSPGQFRKLMKLGKEKKAGVETLLTIEGKGSDTLFYMVEGSCTAKRGATEFTISEPCFLGEISMLLDIPATATVVAQPGSRIIEWSREDLAKLQRRNPQISVALSSLLKFDLAKKVATSVRVAG